MMRVAKSAVDLTRRTHGLFQPVARSPLPYVHLQYRMVTLPGETRSQACQRMQQQMMADVSQYKHYQVFMASDTRFARPEETLKNASRQHGAEKLQQLELGYTESRFFTGHCALAFVDEQGAIAQEHTFSLRPDMRCAPLYRAMPAPDPRLPASLTAVPMLVRPAMHTSLAHEFQSWARDAFYASYVHHEDYLLDVYLQRLNYFELQHFMKSMQELKDRCKRYSLLDHLLNDKLIPSENCTQVASLLGVKSRLGNNPTPQRVAELRKQQLLQYAIPIAAGDGLSKLFSRQKCA